MNYYPDVDKFLKQLYFLNQTWLRNRASLDDEDLKKIFQIRSRVIDDMAKLEFILKGGE